ncbi:hypothetical protein BGZ50_000961 [Haplosporangium sp. Z 11]|nr:hypothetical protein BGZ50_000961 [Haplosporangium sp. Z 11]
MEIVREHLAATALTFNQFSQVLSAFKSSWESILISHSARHLRHGVDPNDTPSISACLYKYSAYTAGKEDLVTPKHICLHGSLLCMVLGALVKPLENNANRPATQVQETELPFSNVPTRSNFRAKTKSQLETARQSLEDRHRQWQLERDCGWLVNLASPLQFDYDRLCKSDCFQKSLKGGSDLSSTIRYIENQRKDLIHRLSSLVLFSSATSRPRPSSWVTEILLELVLRSDGFGVGP